MITRAQIRRQLRKNGGIMNVTPRQGYFLGKIVKAVTKPIKKVVDVGKQVIKSPIGKAAILGLGGAGLMGAGPLGSTLGGLGARIGGGLAGLKGSLFGLPGVANVPDAIGGGYTKGILGKLGLTKGGGSLMPTVLGGLSAAGLTTYFMQKGKTEEEAEQLMQDVKRGEGLGLDIIKEDIKKYRSGILSGSQMFDKGYNFLLPREYIGARGGRVGFDKGSPPTFAEGVKQMYVSDEAGALPKKMKDGEGGVLPSDMGKLKRNDFDSEADYKRYLRRLNKKAQGGRIGYQEGTPAVDPRMHLTPEENIRMNKLQSQMNERARTRGGSNLNQLGGLELRNRFAEQGSSNEDYLALLDKGPAARGVETGAKMYGVKGLPYLTDHSPTDAQIYASYRNQGLSPSQIKAMSYFDTLQSAYGDIRGIGMAMVPGMGPVPPKYDPLAFNKFFTTQGDLDAHYQEGLRRQMLEGSPEVYWDQGSREYKLHDSEYLRNLYNQPSEFEKLSGYKNEKEAIDAMGIEAYNRLMAKGGRVGKYGGGVMSAMPRIPMGMPRVNAGGVTELDYRQEGGFVPVGVKEKADDVPAMLSKNEFVMTADAVKGAGGGNVEKGAQRMYDTMKSLEKRIA